MTVKTPDCCCGFPEGHNVANCERCKFITRITVLESEVEDLRSANADMSDFRLEIIAEYVNTEQSDKLSEILHYCRMTDTRPTVECIERALKGHTFSQILTELPSC